MSHEKIFRGKLVKLEKVFDENNGSAKMARAFIRQSSSRAPDIELYVEDKEAEKLAAFFLQPVEIVMKFGKADP